MNRIIKIITSAALAAAVLITSAVSAGAAGSYFLEEGFYYGVQNGEAYVHGYEGDDWDIVIRELFLGKYYVTAVESNAFFENTAMRALSFYDATGLRSIGDGAFSRCTSLEKVNIPSQIRSMGTGVFDGCTSLTYVRYHKGALDEVPAQTFYGCSALSTVVFLNELRSIGNLAFANCATLERIELPDSVVSIADNAFDGCGDLVIYCSKNSYARTWADKNGVSYILTDPDPEGAAYLRGDADGDEEITILDATHIQRVLAGLQPDDDGSAAMRGDCNGDGLDILDATLIQRYLVGLENPCGIGETLTA